jgi:hypothetical protein
VFLKPVDKFMVVAGELCQEISTALHFINISDRTNFVLSSRLLTME